MPDWLPITPGLVSVVIPMKNGRDYIAAACGSILAERDVSLELIVVDDGSTDGSAEVVRGLGDARATVIAGPCEGNIATSVNAGLRGARGEYLVRCDADDLSVRGRLAWQKAWLESHADYAAIAGAFDTIDPAGRELSPMNTTAAAGEITDELREGKTRTHLNTCMVRMEVARELEGFRPYFSGTEDIDFQLRVGTANRVWFEPRITYRYRLHGTSITHTQATARREFLTATARAFARQRRDTGQDDLQRGCPPTPPADGSEAHDVGQHMQDVLIGRAWREHREGRRSAAVRTAARAAWTQPTRLHGWRQLGVLMCKAVAGRGASRG